MEKSENGKTKRCKGRGVLWFGTGLVAIVATAALVASCGRGGFHHGPHDFEKVRKFAMWKVDDALDDLDATDPQRAKINGIAGEILNDVEGMKKEHMAHKGEVLADFQANRQDPDKLHKLVDDHFADANAFVHRTLDRLLVAYNTLTPDQQQDVLDMWAEHVEDHR